ncbi:MAG: radical SAM protein [Elusimicrobia bacterium]|nr:radical SAM protein [Elusimicrobiota bacterium]
MAAAPSRPPTKVDLKLGYACERQCRFCVQGDLRRRFPAPVTPVELGRALRAGRRRADSVVLTGGEPTLYPYLPELIRLARFLGYRRVQVQSNGRRFSDPAYCRLIAAAGADEFALSIHGSTPEVHDALTRAPGSFAAVWAGIVNLLALGLPVLANTVITRANAADLPALAAGLAAAGVRHVQLAWVHIVGAAAEDPAALVPRRDEAMPYVLRAIDAARAGGARAVTEGVPPCWLPGREDCVAESAMPQMDIYHADRSRTPDYARERREVQKVKGPRCPACRHFAACEGPWKEYPALFGFDEFAPVVG